MKFKRGTDYRIVWFDPGVIVNTDSERVPEHEINDRVATLRGAQYRGTIKIGRLTLLLFYVCTFKDKEHEDLYLIPEGCIIEVRRLE